MGLCFWSRIVTGSFGVSLVIDLGYPQNVGKMHRNFRLQSLVEIRSDRMLSWRHNVCCDFSRRRNFLVASFNSGYFFPRYFTQWKYPRTLRLSATAVKQRGWLCYLWCWRFRCGRVWVPWRCWSCLRAGSWSPARSTRPREKWSVTVASGCVRCRGSTRWLLEQRLSPV